MMEVVLYGGEVCCGSVPHYCQGYYEEGGVMYVSYFLMSLLLTEFFGAIFLLYGNVQHTLLYIHTPVLYQ